MGVQQRIVRHALMLLSVALIGLTACQTRPPAALSGSDEPVIQSVRVDGEPRVGQIVTVTVEYLSSQDESDVWLVASIFETYPVVAFVSGTQSLWLPLWAEPTAQPDLIGTPVATEGTTTQLVTPAPQIFTDQGTTVYYFDRVSLESNLPVSSSVDICVLGAGTWKIFFSVWARRNAYENVSVPVGLYLISDGTSGEALDEEAYREKYFQPGEPIVIEIDPTSASTETLLPQECQR